MIDLRWLEKEVVVGYVGDKKAFSKEKVLQYRELRKVMNKEKMRELGSSYREEKWTDWMDIPTVKLK